MGIARRARSGNIFGGSKLNVPGQGIFNVKLIENDKEFVGPKNNVTPSIKPKPTPTPIPAPFCDIQINVTPLIDICYLSQDGFINLLTEDEQNIILNCDDVP